MKRKIKCIIPLLLGFTFIVGIFGAGAQTNTTFSTATVVNSFPYWETGVSSSNGGSSVDLTSTGCFPGCCSILIYKVVIPTYGSLMIENFNYTPLAGFALAYKSNVPNPTSLADLRHFAVWSNFCGYRDTTQLGTKFSWYNNEWDTTANINDSTHVIPPGDYYIVIANHNNQTNFGDTSTFRFRYVPFCPTGYTCGNVNVSLCSGAGYVGPAGKTYTTSGNYTDTLIGGAYGGGDSLVFISLSVYNSSYSQDSIGSDTLCSGTDTLKHFAMTGYSSYAEFDKSDKDWVECNSIVDSLINTNRSVFGWIKKSSTVSSSAQVLVGMNTSGTSTISNLQIGTNEKLGVNSNYGTSTITDGNWHFVGYTYDEATNLTRIYVDGVEEDNYTSGQSISSTSRISLGQEFDGSTTSNFLEGIFTEVSFWNEVLDSADIAKAMLYAIDSTHPKYANLQAYYPMITNCGDDLSIVKDFSGKGHHGNASAHDIQTASDLIKIDGFNSTSHFNKNWKANDIVVSTADSIELTTFAYGNYTLEIYRDYFTITDDWVITQTPNCSGCAATSSTINPVVCDSFISPSNNYVWKTTNTYTDTINNYNGCDSVITINLTVNSNSSTDIRTACDTFTWTDGITYSSSNNTATDTFTNINGCDSVVTLNLTITSSSAFSATVVVDSNVSCNGYADGGVTVVVTGGTQPYNYTWSNSATTPTLVGLMAGEYIVTVTESNGCTASDSQTVTQPAMLSATVVIDSHATCSSCLDGGATASVSGGTTPYSYLWSNSATTATITGVGRGNYSVTVTDSNGCMASDNGTIIDLSAMRATITVDSSISCYGYSDGKLTVSVVNGTAPFTYAWSNAAGTQSISGVNAGQYSVLVTDNNNDTASAYITLIQPTPVSAAPIVYEETFTHGTTYCPGDPQYDNWVIFCNSLDTSQYSFTSVTLSGSEMTGSVTLNNPVLAQKIAGAMFSGQEVDIVDNGTEWTVDMGCRTSCNISRDAIELNARNNSNGCSCSEGPLLRPCIGNDNWGGMGTKTCGAPTQTMKVEFRYGGMAVTPISCYGYTDGALAALPSGGTPPYAYSWSTSSTDSVITNLGTGSYTLTVTDANGCMDSLTTQLSEPALLTADIVTDASLFCYGDVTAGITANVSGGTTPYFYLWSNNDDTSSLTNLGAGYYSLTVTDNNACTDTASITISNPAPITDLTLTATSPKVWPWDSTTIVTNTSDIFTGYELYRFSDDSMTGGPVLGNGSSVSLNTGPISGLDTFYMIGKRLSEGTAINLDGIDGYLYTFNNNAINPTVTNDITIDAMIYPTASGYVISKFVYGDTSRSNYYINVTGSNKLVVSGNGTDSLISKGDIPFNQWSHIAVVFNHGTDSSMIYIDGALDTAGTLTYNYSNGNDFTMIGAIHTSNVVNDYYEGKIDELRIWNTVRDQDSIQKYISQTVTYNKTDLQAYYQFVNGPGNSYEIDGSGKYRYVYLASLDLDTAWADGFGTMLCEFEMTQKVVVDIKKIDLVITIDSNVKCNGYADGGATAAVSNGTPPYTYSWSNNESTATITGLTAGTYVLTVTDSTGDQVTDSIMITEPTVLSASAVVDSNASCNGYSDAGATVSASGGTSPYTYLWSNSAIDPIINGIGAGTYSVEITDDNGCTASDTITITEPDELMATSVVDHVSCLGGNDGSIDVTISGGTSPYNSMWSNNSNTEDIMNLGIGIYTNTIHDANGCMVTLADTITQPDTLRAGTISFTYANTGLGAVCYNTTPSAINNATSATGGAYAPVYEWQVSTDGTNFSTASGVSDGSSYQPGQLTQAQWYRRVAKDTSCNLMVYSNTVKIEVENPIMAGAISGNTTICQYSAPAKLMQTTTATGAGDDFSHIWQYSTQSTSWTTISGATSADYQPGSLSETTYFRRIDVSTNCQTQDTTNEITITIYAMPVAAFSADNSCLDNSVSFTNNSTISSGTTDFFAWSFDDGQTSSLENPTHKYTTHGNYDVELVVTSNHNCKDTVSKTIMIYPEPVASFSANNDCYGQDINFTNSSSIVSGSISAHNWSFGDGNSSTTTSPSHYYMADGDYTAQLVVTSDQNCRDTIQKVITVYPKPIAGFTSPNACLENGITFTNTSTVNSGSIVSFLYTFGDGNSSAQENPKHNYQSWGSYTVYQYVESDFGCKDTSSDQVSVYPKPVADFSASPGCVGEIVSFIDSSTVDAGNMASYRWDMNDLSGINTQQNPLHVFKAAGTYQVEFIVTTDNGCKDTIVKPLLVTPVPVASFNVADVCFGEAAMFNNTSTLSTGTMTYEWNFGDGNSSTLENPNHVYVATGTYTVSLKVTSDNGCIDEVTQIVKIYELPLVNFNANNECYGDQVTFINQSSVLSGGLSYTWNFGDGQTNTSVNPMYMYGSAGNYSVKLIAQSTNGCLDSLTKPVVVYDKPAADFSVSNDCVTENLQFTNNSSVANGTLTYNWDFNDGSSSTSLNPSHQYGADGSYNVTLIATSDRNCKDTVTKSATVYPLPQPAFSVQNVCDGTNISIVNNSTISSGSISNSWRLGDGNTSVQNNPVHTYQSYGTYNIKLIATSDMNCVDSIAHDVVIYPMPQVDFTMTNVCDGESVQFANNSSVVTGSNTYAWSFGDGNTSAMPVPSHMYGGYGTYQVKLVATTDRSCADSTVKSVQIYRLPSTSLSIDDMSCFGLDNGSVVVNASNGSAPYMYSLGASTYQLSNTFQGLTKGDYTIYVMDANNCADTAYATIQEPDQLEMSINKTNLDCYQDQSGSIEVMATGGTGAYEYSVDGTNYQTGALFSNLAGGYYLVTVRDANQCAESQGVTLYEPQAPLNITLRNITDVDCKGDNTGSIAVEANGGTGQLSYSIDNGPFQAATVFDNLGAGNYKLLVMDDNGCRDSVFTDVTEPSQALTIDNVNVDDVLCYGEESGKLTVQVSGGTASYQFGLDQKMNLQTSSIFDQLKQGSYQVYVVDANGCENSQVVNVGEPTAPLGVQLVNLQQIQCPDDNDGSVEVQGQGGTPVYEYSLDGTNYQPTGLFNGLSFGDYTLYVKDNNECQFEYSVSITPVTVKPIADFDEVLNIASVAFVNKSQFATSYDWDFGDGNTSTDMSPVHTYKSNGDYDVVLIASNACTSDTISSMMKDGYPLNITQSDIEELISGNIRVYPNPVSDMLNVDLTELQGEDDITIQLIDMNGKVVSTMVYSNMQYRDQIRIDMTGMTKGVYLLDITRNSENVKYRIVKK